ncbi:hypothetical protein O3P69_008946 [Scylla paramamosain]|uniref:Uncharacterized protein n=1 Tax=Scylla paramamosain TaxID=85552 RepID=A0AAW0TSF3_SCYPA
MSTSWRWGNALPHTRPLRLLKMQHPTRRHACPPHRRLIIQLIFFHRSFLAASSPLRVTPKQLAAGPERRYCRGQHPRRLHLDPHSASTSRPPPPRGGGVLSCRVPAPLSPLSGWKTGTPP